MIYRTKCKQLFWFFLAVALLLIPGGIAFGQEPVILDGTLSEWTLLDRLNRTPGQTPPGYELYGRYENETYFFAIKTNGTVIGPHTTIWLNTDQDPSTGHLILGFAGGAEFNINIDPGDSQPYLYNGAAAENFVHGPLDYAYGSGDTIIEIALPEVLISSPQNPPIGDIDILMDINDGVFLPGDYADPPFTLMQSLPPEPSFILLDPAGGSSSVDEPRVLSLTVGDGDGYEDIQDIRVEIRNVSGTGIENDTIILEYWGQYNKVMMYNHDQRRYRGGVPGSNLVVEDALCALDVSRTTVEGDGGMLTINWYITPKVAFIGDKIIWLQVFDFDRNRLRIPVIGSWTVNIGQTYELTIGVSPLGSGTTFPSVGNHDYAENEAVTITATASFGYRFVNWTGEVADPSAQSTMVTMDAAKTVTANFVAVPTYALTMGTDPVAGGTTSPGAGEHLYLEGEAVSINAMAYAGYRFVSWTGEVADPNAQSTTVTMDAAKTVTAIFEGAPTYTFTVDYYIQGNVGNRTYQRIGAEDPTPPIFTFEITRADFIAAGFNTLGGNLFSLTISHMHNGDKLDNPENWVLSFDDGSVVTTIGTLGYSAPAFIDETMPGVFDLSGTDWKFILSETSDNGPYDRDRLFLDKVTISNVFNPEP